MRAVLLCLLWGLYGRIATARPLDAIQEQPSRRPFAVVSPIEGHTKLQLEQEGLALIRSLKGPLSPVVVIGPYRSGKSFLLNQLLGVGCEEGFGVGHTRKTQTKGVWVWGEPLEVNGDDGQPPLNLLLFDTEGFEATGKADAYDDRIFALSTVLSAVLVYNLPETVRESDVQALSFAVQLADTFYNNAQAGRASPVEAANMLWLIQRDFLEGQSVQQMVNAALEPVPNPGHDSDIEQVNRIRLSLKTIAKNSTAFGLRQPHLERTRLCEMAESELEESYVRQRNELRQLIRKMSKPKLVNGAQLNGTALASLIERMVAALNSRDIPTAGSILEHFNKDLIQKLSRRLLKKLTSLVV